MLSSKLLTLLRYTRTLWVRVVLISLLSLAAALLAPLLSPLLPERLVDRLDRNAVMPVLTILASSMLAVTTFSLNVMVGAYRAAQSQATPRSYRVLLEDTTTQNALATFTGAFIFSLTAIILFRAQVYDRAASVTVFGFTILVVVLIVLAILRWIDHLTHLGSMDHTLDTLDRRARAPLDSLSRTPHMGGLAPVEHLPEGATPLCAPRGGYVQIVDVMALQEKAEEHDLRIHLLVLPGSHVMRDDVLAWMEGGTDAAAEDALSGFTIGDIRTFEQDARYGLVVLSEIAIRALSPGVNDPGTAIDVIDRLHRLLWERPEHGTGRDDREDGTPRDDGPDCDRVHVPELTAGDLVDAAFGALTFDAAARPDVALRLAHVLAALSREGQWRDRGPARRLGRHLRDRCDEQLLLDHDKAPVRDALS
ncbi:DUF2254 domain-containing protein [Aquicoccus sp. SCR17]|nr:DUF2254 domain-containing protein [Carideicomes alvinocaridis]